MKNRVLRALLLLVAVGAGGAAAYTLWGIDQQLTNARAAEQAVRDQARALVAAIADLRASQQAYVAQGQGAAFWTARVSSLLPIADQRLSAFSGMVTSDGARAALGPARDALENFHKLDARAQEYLRAGEYLMASDLIFSDGLEATTTAAAQVDLALGADVQAHARSLGARRRRQAQILGATSGAIFLVLLLLLPTGRRDSPSESAELHIAPIPTVSEPPAEVATPAQSATRVTLPDLAAAAELCTDLGRVLETRELTALLGRAAQVLDASGMIVWVSDRSGTELRPVLAHGYPDQVLARMGSIPRDAPNATAAAYRTAELRTVSGSSDANGAVVAPLITPAGCIGVLTTELRHGGETKDALRALVAIFAAQLATLVTAPPASSSAAQAQG